MVYETATPPAATFCHRPVDSAVGLAANARNADGSTPSIAVSLPSIWIRAASSGWTAITPGSRRTAAATRGAERGGRHHEQVGLEQPAQRRDDRRRGMSEVGDRNRLRARTRRPGENRSRGRRPWCCRATRSAVARSGLRPAPGAALPTHGRDQQRRAPHPVWPARDAIRATALRLPRPVRQHCYGGRGAFRYGHDAAEPSCPRTPCIIAAPDVYADGDREPSPRSVVGPVARD